MRIIAAFVISADGRITKGDDPIQAHWASKEDQTYFSALIWASKVIIMGSGTYEVVKTFIKLRPDKLRVVITRNPAKYNRESIAGQLEFTSETVKALVDRLKKAKPKQILVVGGAIVFTEFLKANLIDELYLTVEPVLFGKGKRLVLDSRLNIQMQLSSVKQLNKQGTILLHYKIKH